MTISIIRGRFPPCNRPKLVIIGLLLEWAGYRGHVTALLYVDRKNKDIVG